MWFFQNVQIITPAFIVNKENFNLSLQPNSGKSDPPAQLERERQTNVMKPGSWKRNALINGEKQLALWLFFKATCLSTNSLNTRQKWKCNHSSPMVLPCHQHLAALGWWICAWTPLMRVSLQPGCYHVLQFVCFPKQPLLLHFRWWSDQLMSITCSQRDG